MLSIHYLTIAAYAAGLVATLILAAFLTPSRWWQRPNVRALTIVAGGTWGIGTLLMGLAQAPALAATPLAAPALLAAPASTGRTFRVRDDLNLRTGQGIGAQRIAVVPAGTLVTTTGLREGDWWQVTARVGGRDVSGWSSSLWLRRADESRH